MLSDKRSGASLVYLRHGVSRPVEAALLVLLIRGANSRRGNDVVGTTSHNKLRRALLPERPFGGTAAATNG